LKCTQNGYVRQASAAIIDSRHRQEILRDQQNGNAPQLPRAAALDPPYQGNIRQYQASGYTPQIPLVSLQSTYKQDSLQNYYHGIVPQMHTGEFDPLCQLGEPFPSLSQNPIDFDKVEDTGCLDGNISLSLDDQLNIQDNGPARQPDPAYQPSNPLQHANHQSVPQLPADPLTIGARNDRTYSTPNSQQLNCSFEGQHGTFQLSANHYHTGSIFDR
jgi:hypothetical protein